MSPTTDRPAVKSTGGGRTQNPAAEDPRPLSRRAAPVGGPGSVHPVAEPGGQIPSASATVRAGALADGSRGLSGAEWRAAAAKASRRRPAGAAPRAAAKVTIPPATTGGAALTATAHCLRGCGVIAGPGDPAEVDKAAERHTTKPPKHPTNTVSVVAS